MASKTEAYVDTSALIAFLDRSDSYHPLFRRLFASPPRLVTSALVVAEGHGWFLRRYDQNRAIQFLNFIGELSVLAGRFSDVAPDVWLRAATDGGARALGLPLLGALGPGRRPGIIDVRVDRADAPLPDLLLSLASNPIPALRWMASA